MREVSLWLVHGTHVWQALVALSAVLGVAASWLLIDRAMRGRAARVRDALGSARAKLSAEDAGKEIVVTGKIATRQVANGEHAESEVRRAGQPAAATVVPQGFELAEEVTPKALSGVLHTERLEVDVGGTVVALDAPVQILVGARETERCMAPQAARAMLWDFAAQLGKLPDRPLAVRTIAYGDAVRARGILRHEPDYGYAGDYRNAPGVFSLVLPAAAGEEDVAKHLPIAFEGSPRPLARRPLRMVGRAVAFPLGAMVLLGVVGEAAIRVGSPSAAFVAAMTPFRRADALTQLREQLPLASRADERLLARAVELDRLRGRCGDASDDLYHHGSIAASSQTAAACDDPWRAGRGFAAVADFERAAAEFERARALSPWTAPSLTEATAYLASGKYTLAAASARALARSWEGAAGDRDRLECVADAVDARAGTSKALDSLASRKSQHASCALLLADLQSGDERKAVIQGASFWSTGGVTSYPATAKLLQAEDTRKPNSDLCGHRGYDGQYHCGHWSNGYLFEDPAAMYLDPRRSTFMVPAALVAETLGRLQDDGTAASLVERARLTFSLVLLDSLLGKTDLARQRLATLGAHARSKEAAAASAHSEDPRAHGREALDYDPLTDETRRAAQSVLGHVVAFQAAIAVRDFRRDEVGESYHSGQLDLFAAGRAGDPASISKLARRDAREANARLWDLLRAGDGNALAERLRSKTLDGRGVIENARGITSGKDELVKWLRWSYPAACATCGIYPLANRTASRLDAAVALQQPEVESEERGVAERLHALLHRRDIAIPLAVLSELSPP